MASLSPLVFYGLSVPVLPTLKDLSCESGQEHYLIFPLSIYMIPRLFWQSVRTHLVTGVYLIKAAMHRITSILGVYLSVRARQHPELC